ncbi:MAG: hypothetical protein DHS20C17_11220 [Cyclobacteriaceae bacterium]|nr:MAG: hypothetical protein DHS20C17_11220 [Cyclobacteriaceae bacterium]
MRLQYLSITIILLLFCEEPSLGQDTKSTYLIKIDSLHQLIDSYPEEDEEKVHLLNEYARLCFYNLDFRSGLIATRDARLLSEKLEFNGGKIMYYLSLAVFRGNDNMARYYQKQAEWLSMDPEQHLDEYYQKLNYKDHGSGDWGTLLVEFTEMLQYFEKQDDKEIQANLLDAISLFHFRLGDPEKAVSSQDRALQLYKDLILVYPIFNATSGKVFYLNELGRTSEAEKLETELVEFITLNENENTRGLITFIMGEIYYYTGRHALSIEYLLKGAEIFEQSRDTALLAESYYRISFPYVQLEMYDKVAEIFDRYIEIVKHQNDSVALFDAYNRAVMPNYFIKDYEKARKYMALALRDKQNQVFLLGRKSSLEGQIVKDQQQYTAAIPYFQQALESYQKTSINGLPFMHLYLAECYQQLGDFSKALEHGLLCLQTESETGLSRTKVKLKISLILSEIYDTLGQQQRAYQYLKMHQDIRAENDRLDAKNRLADAEVRAILQKSQKEIEQIEQERILADQENKVQRLWIFSITGALLSAIVLALVLYRNNKNKQKANALLKEQKEEIESTLEKLESTQSQLIQSEKMASLGELTAGIAHEIQNPLNFVNNFAEVSEELVTELKEELDKGDVSQAKIISDDVIETCKKINHHGQRASSIVKGMLEHSRSGNGKKEPTDINALTDEYLRLAYHGLRAKDKSFNADFKTDLDETLPKVKVIPQEIGRVLLNLINNAFYAVDKRAKEGINGYKPELTITTKLSHSDGNKGEEVIEIRVADNGSGVPADIKNKIFQPFFTTKPTGSGTGLGLSLSYDIVKAHGGTLEMDSKEGKGSEFVIHLPNN